MNWGELVFKTSENQSLIIVSKSGLVLYLNEGTYGGYILKPKQLGLSQFSNEDQIYQLLEESIAFFVVPEIKGLGSLTSNGDFYQVPKEHVKVLSKYLNQLPDKVRDLFFSESAEVQLVTYKYVQVQLTVSKVAPFYAVLDAKPFPNGCKVTAKALRLKILFTGTRRHSKGTLAGQIVHEWRLEFPENHILNNYIYAVNRYEDYRDSAIFLKIVVESPKEPLPFGSSLEESEPMPVVINGFLVVSRLPSKALLDTHLPEVFKNVKVGTKLIKLVMGYFYNKLGTLSRKFYCQILPKYAIYAGFGYIVPKSKVSEFLSAVEELKEQYAEYERQLKEFLLEGKLPDPEAISKRAKICEEYRDLIMDYLRHHGKESEVRAKIESLDVVGRVSIQLIPFSVDSRILYEFADEKVKKRMEKELQEFRNQMAESLREQIRRLASTLINNIKECAKVKVLESARRRLSELEKMANDLGVELEELKELKEFVKKDIEEIVAEVESDRVKALLSF
ncbi:MAG: hypothetical protein DRN90_00305 [Thermoproteota archaeon]|nr:MAG: hypothetical protein DRN90_00305 [Candidatus Korarchaeota archaeon]